MTTDEKSTKTDTPNAPSTIPKRGLELNRIYNMDCLEGMKLMEDKSVDLVLTDPPYGIGMGDTTNRKVGVDAVTIFGRRRMVGMPAKKDYPSFNDSDIPDKWTFLEMFRISKNQVFFGGNYFELPPSSCWIVWDKDNGANYFADCELAWTSFNTAVRKFTWRWNGLLQEDMAHKEERFHPTQKPVKLFEWIIKNYAKEGDIICDPFFGSGSSLVAAIRMGHPFIGFEKEKVYFDAAEKRIKKAQEQGKITGWFE